MTQTSVTKMHARARELLGRVPYAAVATTDGDRPWNSPVAVGHDDRLDFFWMSAKEAVHSRNVRASGRAFLVIFNSTIFLASGAFTALYLDCSATELSDLADVAHGLEMVYGRSFTGEEAERDALGSAPHRIYRATPEKAWMNDRAEADGVGYDVRTELDLRRVLEPS